MNVFFIGGSPCSGKSTIAEILSRKYGLHYFKVDDHLDKYTRMGAEVGYPICKKQMEMSTEQIWMRTPQVQCEEELQFYEEIFPFILQDLKKLDSGCAVITEGTAYLPNLIKQIGIPNNKFIAMVPTEAFQIYHYSKREWVPYVLAECSNPEKAFQNWMERDILFAQEVAQRCSEVNYQCVVNNGDLTIERMEDMLKLHFGLGDKYEEFD